MKSKYVIIEHRKLECVIVFSPCLLHQDVAGDRKLKAAGFCELDADGRWVVSGKSLSLEYGCRPQDVDILNTHLLGRSKRPLDLSNREQLAR